MATSTQTMMSHDVFSARRFIGKDVFDVNGEHVGEVEDLILNVQTACAKWGILSTGGVLGIGEKYRIVPVQAMSIETDTGRLMLQVPGDKLTNGPMYDRNNPPDWGDDNWQRSVNSFYGLQSGGSGMGGQQAYEQGYEQGYEQAMQRQSTPQSGYMQGESPDRRTHSSQGYSGRERRGESAGRQSQMRQIGQQQSSSEAGSMRQGSSQETSSQQGHGQEYGGQQGQKGDRDWIERT